MTATQQYSYIPARTSSLKITGAQFQKIMEQPQARRKLGIGMDADLVAPLSNPAISTPAQFVQAWAPGYVQAITQARVADRILGTVTLGQWHDQEVVQMMMEATGNPAIYQDHTQIPFASWNPSFERRSIVRFELGLKVTKLEDARAGAMQASTIDQKRWGVANALGIGLNSVAFYGYADGVNRTFGILNDPNLLPYLDSPAGAGGETEFVNKTVNERISTILLLMQTLITQSGTQVSAANTPTILSVPSNMITTFLDINEFGVSVQSWMSANFPMCRIEPIPEFNEANGGESVMYLVTESVPESGTDGGQVAVQLVPTKFQTIGTEQRAKGYVEDFTNATAGVMVKRPFAITRMTGV